jgi:hypothetical protein
MKVYILEENQLQKHYSHTTTVAVLNIVLMEVLE